MHCGSCLLGSSFRSCDVIPNQTTTKQGALKGEVALTVIRAYRRQISLEKPVNGTSACKALTVFSPFGIYPIHIL